LRKTSGRATPGDEQAVRLPVLVEQVTRDEKSTRWRPARDAIASASELENVRRVRKDPCAGALKKSVNSDTSESEVSKVSGLSMNSSN